jgi:hypothetical protein
MRPPWSELGPYPIALLSDLSDPQPPWSEHLLPCHPRHFMQISAALLGTASALLGEVAGQGAVGRLEAACGIAADNLLTGRKALLGTSIGRGRPVTVRGTKLPARPVHGHDMEGVPARRGRPRQAVGRAAGHGRPDDAAIVGVPVAPAIGPRDARHCAGLWVGHVGHLDQATTVVDRILVLTPA